MKIPKLPKIPIDYSKTGTGEAPFDRQYYFLFADGEESKASRRAAREAGWPEGAPCLIGKWDIWDCVWDFDQWKADEDEAKYFTHYSIIPKFEPKGGE